MSNFKHTPGPWHVEHYSRGSCEVRITRPKESKGLGPVAYALMDLAGAMTAERISEMKANARLIAAAPDLLDALQKLVDSCADSDGAQYGTLGTSFVRSIATAAIAKATGEAA
jgi:hypothetical protein